jgi:hypothetical protein
MKKVGATGFEAECHFRKRLFYRGIVAGVYFGADWGGLFSPF